MPRITTKEHLDEAERMPDLTFTQLVHIQVAKTDIRNPPSRIDYIQYIARLWAYLQEIDPDYALVLKTTYIKLREKKRYV